MSGHVERIKAEEHLARVCATMPTPQVLELAKALQAYHEQYYDELVAATTDNVVRAQGKVQAIQQIVKTVATCRDIVTKIDTRRNITQPRPPQDGRLAGML